MGLPLESRLSKAHPQHTNNNYSNGRETIIIDSFNRGDCKVWRDWGPYVPWLAVNSHHTLIMINESAIVKYIWQNGRQTNRHSVRCECAANWGKLPRRGRWLSATRTNNYNLRKLKVARKIWILANNYLLLINTPVVGVNT